MKARLNHLQLYVSNKDTSFPFYKDLLECLGFKTVYTDDVTLGMDNGEVSIWINKTQDAYKHTKYHRKNTGLNHIAFSVDSKEDVDKFSKEFLKIKNIPALYNSPKLFPEYTDKYYAVYFEDPDRIKLEVVYL
jgi:catechol-2,3-dioxygenase